MAEFLLEIGLEEIPARMIAAAEAELAARVQGLVTRERLAVGDLTVRGYSTPRRLAVNVSGLASTQADTEETLTGPSWAIAFKDGAPTAAAYAFAKKAGVAIEAFAKVSTPKGEYVTAVVHRAGRPAAEVLTTELPKEIGALAWPKNMYWRAGKPERYVRPVKWLLALLDHAILPVEFAGVHAANLTYGHRILHGAHAVTIDHPDQYLSALEGAKVMADVSARRHRIRKALDHATRTVADMGWREDEPLVETVVHLTEWPSVVLGSFAAEFLALPEEVLVTVMRDHQKYFAVEDGKGKLAPHFLTILNTEADGQGLIRHGNERVLRARFNDAQFFWNFDQKTPLVDRVELLKSVTFQKDLGSYHEKTLRTRAIALGLAQLAGERGIAVDTDALSVAAQVAKADLTSELVKEFTELQGIVGGLYARAQELGETAAQAIYWQYQPASSTDPIPPTIEGQLLGLAERIGTIVDMFAFGLEPTGSKDPYALRRSANAVVRILAEGTVPLLLSELLAAATHQGASVDAKVVSFFAERVGFYLRDVRSFSYDVVFAVMSASAGVHGESTIKDMIARCEALAAVRNSEDFAAIAAAFKRSNNILSQARQKNLWFGHVGVKPELFVDPAERALHDASLFLIAEVESRRRRHDYVGALEQIATLRPHVDLFFDKVMVMVEDEAVRENRLALLSALLSEFSKIADFSAVPITGFTVVQTA
jgi:glycyl-tRNA synthetase beta chain